MADIRDNTIRRIKSLLERAAHEKTPQDERDSATAMAMRLIAKYDVDNAELSYRNKGSIERYGIKTITPFFHSETFLCEVIAKHCSAQVIFGLPDEIGKSLGFLVAYESDKDRFLMLYDLLMVQLINSSSHIDPTDGDIEQTFSRMSSFMYGFAEGIDKKMTSAKEQAESENKPGALVLVNKASEVDKAMQMLNDELGGTEEVGFLVHDKEELMRGQMAGANSDVGHSKVSNEPDHVPDPKLIH